MSGIVTVSSTTDDQKAVEEAAAYGEQTLPFDESEKPGPSDVEETETAAEPEPAEVPENEEPQEEVEEPEPEEEEEPEAAQAAPPPRSKRDRERGLVAQVQRQAAQISDLEEQIRKLTASPSPQEEAPKRPDSSDQKYKGKRMEDVMEDVVDYKLQKLEQDKAEQQQREAQQKRKEWADNVLRSYHEQVVEARAKYSDFNQAVDPVRVGPLAEEVIKRMSNGAEVAYYLGKNPDFVTRLTDWDQSQQAEDANRIVQSLQNLSDELRSNNGSTSAPSSAAPRSPQPRPAAPRPLRHVGSSSTATTPSVDPGKMSMKDYNDWRNAGGGR